MKKSLSLLFVLIVFVVVGCGKDSDSETKVKAFLERAEEEVSNRNIEEAKKWYDKAFEIDPTNSKCKTVQKLIEEEIKKRKEEEVKRRNEEAVKIKSIEQTKIKENVYIEEPKKHEEPFHYTPINNGEVAAKYYIEWVLYVLKMEVSNKERVYLIQWAGPLMRDKIDRIDQYPRDVIEREMRKNYDISKFDGIREDNEKQVQFKELLDTDKVPITIRAIEETLNKFRKINVSEEEILKGRVCYWDIIVDMYDTTPLGKINVDSTKFRIKGVVESVLGQKLKVIISNVEHIDNRSKASLYYLQNIEGYKRAVTQQYLNKVQIKDRSEVSFE